MDPAALSRDRRHYLRIIVAWQDLDHARAAINRLLGLNNETPVPLDDETVRLALLTSAIVSYARLFASGRSTSTVPSCLPRGFRKRLTEERRALHDRMLVLRSREFAHSDAAVADVKVGIWSDPSIQVLVPISRKLRSYSVSDADLRVLDAILAEVHRYLIEEVVRLQPLLHPHGPFDGSNAA